MDGFTGTKGAVERKKGLTKAEKIAMIRTLAEENALFQSRLSLSREVSSC
jgi:hypothetical protein